MHIGGFFVYSIQPCNLQPKRKQMEQTEQEVGQLRQMQVSTMQKLKSTERLYFQAKDAANVALRKQDKLEKRIEQLNRLVGVLLSAITLLSMAIIHLIIK